MEIKLFEVRDRGTCIPVMAIQPSVQDPHSNEEWLLERAGYGKPFERYIILIHLLGSSGKWTCDPHEWDRSRTMTVSHEYIRKYWEDLSTGDVIDVEYILEETSAPKESDRQFAGSAAPHPSHRWSSLGVCDTCGILPSGAEATEPCCA